MLDIHIFLNEIFSEKVQMIHSFGYQNSHAFSYTVISLQITKHQVTSIKTCYYQSRLFESCLEES